MNKSRSARSLARGFAALTAAAVLTSVFAGPAAAEDPTPTSTVPATSEAPSTVPSESDAPAPEPSSAPSSTQPENKPAAAQPQDEPAPRARIAVSIGLDKDVYTSADDVHFTVKLTNVGEVTAEGVEVYQYTDKPTDLDVQYGSWGDLGSGPGLRLEPGQSYERTGVGHVRDVRQDTVTIRGILFDKTGFTVSSEFGASAKVTTAPGEASGVVYGDKNGNGARDGGEELAGIKLTLRYVHGDVKYTATSDEKGNLTFKVPAADYYLGGEVVDGWLFPFRTVHVGEGTKLDLRGAPPLNGALKASMKFTKDSYQVGELAHVSVTLSNSGPIPLVGIVAECNRIGDDYMLSGRTPGWGDLARGGVTIAAGETRVIDVSEAVPQAAFHRGFVMAACDFGYYEVDTENHADTYTQAAVPGDKAIVEGNIGVFDNQGQVKQGLAGVKVVLVSDQHCPVVGERTTDAKGHFEFLDVAPGPEFRLYLLPPAGWKIKYEDNPMWISVWGPPENHHPWRIDAEEGDAPLPTVPVNPADCTAVPPTSTTGAAGGTGGTGGGRSGGSGLASTGVDAIGLGALALIALALGGGLVFGARRRRRTT